MRGQFPKREHRLAMSFNDYDTDLERAYCGREVFRLLHVDAAKWLSRLPPRTVAWVHPTRLPRPGPEDPYLMRFEHPARSLPLALDHRHKWAYLGQSDWPLLTLLKERK